MSVWGLTDREVPGHRRPAHRAGVRLQGVERLRPAHRRPGHGQRGVPPPGGGREHGQPLRERHRPVHFRGAGPREPGGPAPPGTSGSGSTTAACWPGSPVSCRRQVPGLIVSTPDASIYSVLDVREVVKPGFDAQDFVMYCARQRGRGAGGPPVHAAGRAHGRVLPRRQRAPTRGVRRCASPTWSRRRRCRRCRSCSASCWPASRPSGPRRAGRGPADRPGRGHQRRQGSADFRRRGQAGLGPARHPAAAALSRAGGAGAGRALPRGLRPAPRAGLPLPTPLAGARPGHGRGQRQCAAGRRPRPAPDQYPELAGQPLGGPDRRAAPGLRPGGLPARSPAGPTASCSPWPSSAGCAGTSRRPGGGPPTWA